MTTRGRRAHYHRDAAHSQHLACNSHRTFGEYLSASLDCPLSYDAVACLNGNSLVQITMS